MGIKLEYVLIVLILITVLLTTMAKLTNTTATLKPESKELEFTQTTFIEVDKNKMLSNAFAQKGLRENAILRLEHLTYTTKNIALLIADKAKYHGNILYLDGNVRLEEKEGYSYSTEHAKYNQKSEILIISSPFIALRDKNSMHGDSLYYDAVKKEMNATKMTAVVYTAEK